tara:strand:+ start:1476 stop:2570 length:1095 start_codon:yes stop_codon:yes gene_type:complete
MSMHRLCCCDGGTELTTFYVRCEALRFPHAYFEIGNQQDEAGDPKLDFWVLVEEGVLIPEDQGNPEHLYIYDLPFISRPATAWFVTHPTGPKEVTSVSRGGAVSSDLLSFRNLFLATDDIEPDLDSVIARGRNFATLIRTPEPFDPDDPQQVCAARATHFCISSLAIDPSLEDCNCQRESFSRTAAAPGLNHPDVISFLVPGSGFTVHNPYSGVTQLSFTSGFNYLGNIQTVTLDLVPQNQSSDGGLEYTGVFDVFGNPVEITLRLSGPDVLTPPSALFPRVGLAYGFGDVRYLQDQTRYDAEQDEGCNPSDDSFTTDHFCGGIEVFLRVGPDVIPVLSNCTGAGGGTTLRWFGDRIEKFNCCP